MKTKINPKNTKGFTLIELLLVIAIIGILTSVLFVNMGSQRRRARAMAALESVDSAIPYVAECYLRNKTVTTPNANGGNDICGAGTSYPAIGTTASTTGCTYTGGGTAFNNPITVSCNGGSMIITCNYAGTANCTKTGF